MAGIVEAARRGRAGRAAPMVFDGRVDRPRKDGGAPRIAGAGAGAGAGDAFVAGAGAGDAFVAGAGAGDAFVAGAGDAHVAAPGGAAPIPAVARRGAA